MVARSVARFTATDVTPLTARRLTLNMADAASTGHAADQNSYMSRLGYA